MRTAPALLSVLAFALVAGGCSSAEGTDPATPTPAALPTSPTEPLDGGPGANVDGSVDGATPPQPTANDYSADTCGNGVDDDHDGLVDDACPVTACTLKLSEPIATGRVDGLSFLKGTGDFVAFGRAPAGVGASAIQRFVGGSASGAAAALDSPISQLSAFPGGPILLTPAGTPGLLKSKRLDPATLSGIGDWSVFPTAAAPSPAWTPALFDTLRFAAINGSVWMSAHLKDQLKVRIGRLDASLALQATYDIDLLGSPGATEIISLGGMPYVYQRAQSGYAASTYEAYTRVVALGDTAPRFATESFHDTWSGDVLSWGGAGHVVTGQALDKVLVCRGGPREHAYSAHSFMHQVDCHVASASTGATLGAFALTDYALGDVSSELRAAPNGADFLLARTKVVNAILTELHIDRLTVSGTLTKDIVAPVPIPSTFVDRIVETGPNQYAVVYRTGTSPGEIFVRMLGCAP
jgi:hypothetical protein